MGIDLGRRVVVYGPSGSGKTTVGRVLATRLQVPFVELDAVFHARPGWQDLSRDEFRREVTARLAACPDGWVFDGNYDHVRDLLLPRADSVVWLRLPFPVVYARLVARTLRRGYANAELWGGNRESLRQAFLSRDSMLLWGLTAWRPHHRAAARALATLPHGPVHELRSPRAVRTFLADVTSAGKLSHHRPATRVDSPVADRHLPPMPAPVRFKVGLVQMRCTSDPAANVDRAVAGVRDAAARGAGVVCLPELFRTQYFCQREDAALFDLAEPIPGPTSERMAAVAKELGVVVIASLFERRAAGVYHNTAVVLDSDGRLAGRYRKMHIPDDPLYYEKFYFTPGDLGFGAFDTAVGKVGTLVCWDQWYPEGARLTALAGADVLFYPTAIGWHPSEKAEWGERQLGAWQTIQRAHAIANGVYVAAVNRVGHEGSGDAGAGDGGIEFWGASFVCDPFGAIVAEAPRDAETVLIVECDRALQEDVRRNWPFLRDRRIDAYGGITQRLLDR